MSEARPLGEVFRLTDKVAVVTGASRSIGAAVAHRLSEAGATVIATARGLEELEATVESIRQRTGGTIVAVRSDATLAGDRRSLVEWTLDTFGHVDVLVNNAYAGAASMPTTLLRQLDDHWNLCFEGNVIGPFELIRGFAPGMLQTGAGSIINIVSSSAFSPVYGQGAYGSSKAALLEMTRYFAQELAPCVRVNAISPGTINPEGTVGADQKRGLVNRVPLARFGAPDEVALAAVFLGSAASSYITGDCLFIDGGRVNVGTAGRDA